MPDFDKLRQDFPMLSKTMHGHPLIYFDSAATAQKPMAVVDAMKNFYCDCYSTVHRAVYDLAMQSTQEYQEVRKKVGKFINAAKEEEVVFTKGTTESINLVAHSFGRAFIQPGDEILIGGSEHHANIVPWQIACQNFGASLKVIPVDDDGALRLDVYRKLLNEKTRIVAVAHVANTIGTINPVKEIIDIAHEAGAKVLIDGAQSVPHMAVNVQALDCDFYAFSGHKAYGPTGVGVLYGKESLLEVMPPYQGGGDMIEAVTFEKTTYNTLPTKFEAGTPMIAQVIGLGAAVQYIEDVGIDEIFRRDHLLLAHATKRLQGIEGLRIIGPTKEKGPIISFVIENVHPLDLGTLLNFQGVAVRTGHHCAQPILHRFGLTSTTRMSLAFYNTLEEIDRFAEILKDVISRLK